MTRPSAPSRGIPCPMRVNGFWRFEAGPVGGHSAVVLPVMFLTRDEARELDRRAMDEWGIPGVVLMENAGRGMAELLKTLGIQGTVVVCSGRGNNGGDGFVIARHLDNAGVPVRVLLFARPEELAGDAGINYRI